MTTAMEVGNDTPASISLVGGLRKAFLAAPIMFGAGGALSFVGGVSSPRTGWIVFGAAFELGGAVTGIFGLVELIQGAAIFVPLAERAMQAHSSCKPCNQDPKHSPLDSDL